MAVLHQPHAVFAPQKRADHVNIKVQFEVREAAILDAFKDHIAGIIDQNVEPAVAFLNRAHDFDPLLFTGNVQCHRIAADLGRHLVRQFGIAVGDDHARPFARQSLAIGLAQPHRPACHERNLARYPSRHLFSPNVFCDPSLSGVTAAATVESAHRPAIPVALAQVAVAGRLGLGL